MAHAEYTDFLDRVKDRIGAADAAPLTRIYHAVRNIPYGAAGMRDPRKVFENNLGSCSGKHILLRDLLRRAGYAAEAVTIFTHFSRGVPENASYPAELRRMIQEDEVQDFHHYVRVRNDGDWLKLDATWHDRLIPYGFPVNSDWRGAGDTTLAATPIKEYPAAEDLAAYKEELLATLPPEERDKRVRFFRLLGEWMSGL